MLIDDDNLHVFPCSLLVMIMDVASNMEGSSDEEDTTKPDET